MIVVTAPTGQIGHQVLELLLQAGERPRVIARDPGKLPAAVRDRVEVVGGSHGDAAVVDRAFAGADAVFWLPPPSPRAASLDDVYVGFARPAAAAVKQHGVKRVVGISALGRGASTNAGYVTATLAVDDLFAATGVAYRALVMPSFMDNTIRQVAPIRDKGMFFGPLSGSAKHPTCANRDIAAVAAKWLLDPTWTGVEQVPVLGPEDLSPDDMAAIMSEVLGKPVRYQQVPMAGFKATLLGNGMSEAMAQGMVDMMTAKEAGLDDAEPRTPEGTTPTTFRQWCETELAPAVRGATGAAG